MNPSIAVSTLAAASLIFSACGGGDSPDSSAGLVDAADANAVTDVLRVRLGDLAGKLQEGELPAATQTGSEPVVSAEAAERAVLNGETVSLGLQIDTASALASLLLKVLGADDLFVIDVSGSGESKVTVAETLALDIPDNITDGTFCIAIVAIDDADRVSAAEQVCFNVESTADDAPPDPVAQLQGIWDVTECDRDGITSDSFKGSWEFRGNTIRLIEAQWGNSTCSGDPEDAYQEDLTYSIGQRIASDVDGDTYEFTATNLTEGGSFSSSIKIGQDQFELLAAFEDDITSTFVKRSVSGVAFSNAFLSGKTFDAIFDANTGDTGTFQFNTNGTGEITFAGLAPGDTIPITWSVNGDGTFGFTEIGDNGNPEDIWTFFPIIVDAERAISWHTVVDPGAGESSGLAILEATGASR